MPAAGFVRDKAPMTAATLGKRLKIRSAWGWVSFQMYTVPYTKYSSKRQDHNLHTEITSQAIYTICNTPLASYLWTT